MKEFREVKSKTILKKFFNIIDSEIEIPDGKTKHHYTVDLFDSVSIIILQNGKIPLVGQYRHSIKKYVWDLPSGYVEKNETSEQAIIRESQEEVGLKPTKLQLIAKNYIWSGISPNIHYTYFSNQVESSSLKPDDLEFLNIKYFSINEVEKYLIENLTEESFEHGFQKAKSLGYL